MTNAYINRIETEVPPHDVHQSFVQFARTLLTSDRTRAVFDRLVAKSHIEHRYSILDAPEGATAASDGAARIYVRDRFPPTGLRMQLYAKHAPTLAVRAARKLELGADAARVTHVIVTSCTGMVAPGVDLALVEHCGLDPSVERTVVGFMGCYAAMNALKLADHVVRSRPSSVVLVVNVELCSLHLQQTTELEQLLSFLVFADGCAASIVSAEPRGLALDRFDCAVFPGTADLITWTVGDHGFDMHLSGRVPGAVSRGVAALASEGRLPRSADLWAVHPGGRSILDAVEQGLELPRDALAASREVLAGFGNMSSATVMFVLRKLLRESRAGQEGWAMSFGPGLTAETMAFHKE